MSKAKKAAGGRLARASDRGGRFRPAKRGEVVTLPRARYEALLERLEDLEDARIIREEMAKRDPRDDLPAELVKRMLKGEHKARIWREQRGLTLSALAEKAGIPVSYLSEIETGKKPGSVEAYRKLAAALGLSLDDLAG